MRQIRLAGGAIRNTGTLENGTFILIVLVLQVADL